MISSTNRWFINKIEEEGKWDYILPGTEGWMFSVKQSRCVWR